MWNHHLQVVPGCLHYLFLKKTKCASRPKLMRGQKKMIETQFWWKTVPPMAKLPQGGPCFQMLPVELWIWYLPLITIFYPKSTVSRSLGDWRGVFFIQTNCWRSPLFSGYSTKRVPPRELTRPSCGSKISSKASLGGGMSVITMHLFPVWSILPTNLPCPGRPGLHGG